MNRNSNLAKNTLLLSIGQFFPRVTAMFTLPILTAYLSKAEYGTYDLANSLVSLIIPLMTLQIQQIAFKYLILAKEKEEKDRYVSTSSIFVLISSVIFFIVIFVGLRLTTNYSIRDISLIGFFLMTESYYLLVGQYVRALGSNMKYSIGVVVFASLQLIMTYVTVKILQIGIVGAFLSYSISYLIAIIYMIYSSKLFSFFSIKTFSFQTLRKFLSLSSPIVPSSIGLWVSSLSDRVIITAVLGIEMNAIYAVAYKIPNLFNMAYSTFNLAWTESATIASEDEDKGEYYSEMLNSIVSFLVGIMLILIAFTPILFKIFIDNQYIMAYGLMPLLFFSIFFNCLVSFYGAIYVALNRTKQVGVSSVIGAILNILINLVFIRKIGLQAGALSTALSFLCILVYRMYDINKVINLTYNWKKISFSMLVFVFSSVLCYIHTTISMLVCFIIAILYNIFLNKLMTKIVKKVLKR